MEYYTITQCDSSGNVLATYPILFDSFKQAQNYLNVINSTDLSYNIVRNNSSVVLSQTECLDDDLEEELDYDQESLEGYTLVKFGNGYLLRTTDDDEMYGQSYFYGKEFDGGWWNSSKSGWFFKNTHLDMLVERGAQMETSTKRSRSNPYSPRTSSTRSTRSSHKTVKSEPFSSTDPFNGCTWVEYGRGYLLKPRKNHPEYGEKYFGDYADGGWWNANQSGWFFKKDAYTALTQ
jgi:hypothetical protein